jgi:hypothetical protein
LIDKKFNHAKLLLEHKNTIEVGRVVFITKTNVFSWWLLRLPPYHGLNTRAIRLQLKVLVFSFVKG